MSKIYINPGHGGADSGAVGIGGRQEKDDALRYASAVAEKLRAAGHDVKLERDGDYLINVKDIAAKANAWGADYFIAFHRNSGGGTGAECLIVSSASAKSREMAQAIQNALAAVGFKNRGVKVQDKNTYVLSHTTMPATTIECGFIDNAGDNALFDSKFEQICSGIANAVFDVVGGSVPQGKEETLKPVNQKAAEEFIGNLYWNVLGREADRSGWDEWVSALLERRMTPEQVAYNFYFSDEEMKQKDANEDFIQELYRGLIGRDADADGLEYWSKGSYKDMSREDLFYAFVRSSEFLSIKEKMGF
jgi:N-acetylmuramoyl-L-alanine amidase